MSNFDIVRAWKDTEYRHGLSAEEQALLPEHPAGLIELADEDLPQVVGGIPTIALPCSLIGCSFDDCTLTTTTITLVV